MCGCPHIYLGKPLGTFEFYPSDEGGTLSPDGIHFAAVQPATTIAGSQDVLREYVRAPDGRFRQGPLEALTGNANRARFPRYFGSVDTLMLSRTGTNTTIACDRVVDRFTGDGPDFRSVLLGLQPGVTYSAVTASHDARYLALVANQDNTGPLTQTAVRLDDGGYGQLVNQDTVSPGLGVEGQEVPQWLSDDGLTLFFRSLRQPATGMRDQDHARLYRATRAAPDAPFECAAPVLNPTPSMDDETLTMPSMATMEANGCEADGFLHRRGRPNTPHAWFRVRVCVGHPCVDPPADQVCRLRISGPASMGTDGGAFPCGDRSLHLTPGAELVDGAGAPSQLDNASLAPRGDGFIAHDRGGRLREYALLDGGIDIVPLTSVDEAQFKQYPQLTADRLGLFACAEATRSCKFGRRAATTDPFVFGDSPTTGTMDFLAVPPWGWRNGLNTFNRLYGTNRTIVPSGNGQWIAFETDWNMVSPTCEFASMSSEVNMAIRTRGIWTARAIDPTDPSRGYTDYLWHLSLVPTAPHVLWLSDDGLTLIFEDLARFKLTTRDSVDHVFRRPTELTALSQLGAAVALALSSLTTIEENGCRAQGYAATGSNDTWRLVDVCLGNGGDGGPCPP